MRAHTDIVEFHSQFFNVIAELFPQLADLHYGLTPPAESQSWAGMVGRLTRGPKRLLDRVAHDAGMARWPAGSRGLDLGCGLGGTSAYLAREFGFEMTGVNINSDQLALARQRLTALGLADQITLRLGDATGLDLPDNSFDFACLIEVAFHVQDKPALFAEVRRVLRPGGTLVLVDQEHADDMEVMGLFWFVREGSYGHLAREADLSLVTEQDLSDDLARWMEDYVRAASLPFHAGAVLAALARLRPALAWRYLSGVRYFSRLILDDFADRGVALPWTHPLAGVKLLRTHTLDELRRGRMRYKLFVMRASAT